MKFGVNLINFGPGVGPDSMEEWVHTSEECGYHLVMTSDHIAIPEEVQSRYPAPFYEPISTLGWMSGITKSIEIGTTVFVAPYRHILETAKACSSIDQFSNGRLICGFGVGWSVQEYEALGVPYHSRGAITNEYLAALKVLWTNDIASYKGRFISFENIYTAPKPKRVPPIWVGGYSDAALKRAVDFADAWHPIRISLSNFKTTGIARLARIANQSDKPSPDICPRIKLKVTPEAIKSEDRLAGHGTIAQIRDDLLTLEELGCQYVLFDTYNEDHTVPDHARQGISWLVTLADQILDLKQETIQS